MKKIDKKTLDRYKSIALSNFDLVDLLDGKATVMLYPDMYKINSIEQLLHPYDACFLLFETEPRMGHWCALLKYGDTVEFFDPYSGYPDDVLKFIPKDFKKKSKQDYPYLTKLLYECPYKIEFNDNKYQKHNNNINTCGRHCALRILCKDLDNKQYDKMIKKLQKETGMNPDDLVTAITMGMSGGRI